MQKQSNPRFSIIIPVFNEEQALPILLKQLNELTQTIPFEVIISDGGSTDATIALVRELDQDCFYKITVIEPFKRTSLVASVLKGFEVASASHVVVMDGDGQHSVEDLNKIVERSLEGDFDLVVGERRVASVDTLSDFRKKLSDVGNKLISYVLGVTEVNDPLTGFFCIKRSCISSSMFSSSPEGFKILVHILGFSKVSNIDAVDISFEERSGGESKLSVKILLQFVAQLGSLVTKGMVPPTFLLFAMIGSMGACLHFGVFYSGLGLGLDFFSSNISALILASWFNFLVNNSVTFSDNQLKGDSLRIGLLKYFSISIFSAVGATMTSEIVFEINSVWLFVMSGFSAIIDSVFKFFIVKKLVWKV